LPEELSSIKHLRKGVKQNKPNWAFHEISMPHKFLPSSRHVFLDLQNILLFGGLDDTHSDMEPFFTNYCYKLSLVNRSFNEQLYVCHSRSAMTYSRGDFAICHNNGFVFIFGGSVNVSHT